MQKLRPGDLFAHQKYRLVQNHDTGGFATIWRAIYLSNVDEVAALKIFPVMNETARKQIRAEMELAATLHHDSLIVPVHIDTTEDGNIFLKMPFCAGGNASELVGQMGEPQAAAFLRQIAGAGAYLHGRRVVHGDIKPNNVLLGPIYRRENDPPVVLPPGESDAFYLCDLSLSRSAQQTLRRTLNMWNEGVVDSPASASFGLAPACYRAPELFEGDCQPILASDVWALGATLFELLTGLLPFGDLGGLTQKGQPGYDPNTHLPSIEGKVGPAADLNLIVRSCLHKNPWDRPKMQDLEKFGQRYTTNGQWLESGERQILLDKFVALPPPPKQSKRSKLVLGVGSGLLSAIVIAIVVWLITKIALLMEYADSVKAKGFCEQAERKYVDVLKLDENYQPAKNALDEIYTGKCKKRPDIIAKYINTIKESVSRGDCENARRICEEWISFAPGDDPPKNWLNEINEKIKNRNCNSQ
jgi:serine/threonine protein kinase